MPGAVADRKARVARRPGLRNQKFQQNDSLLGDPEKNLRSCELELAPPLAPLCAVQQPEHCGACQDAEAH